MSQMSWSAWTMALAVVALLNVVSGQFVWKEYREEMAKHFKSFEFLEQATETEWQAQRFESAGTGPLEGAYPGLKGKDYIVVDVGSASTQAFKVKNGRASLIPIDGSVAMGAKKKWTKMQQRKLFLALAQARPSLKGGENAPVVFTNAISYGLKAVYDKLAPGETKVLLLGGETTASPVLAGRSRTLAEIPLTEAEKQKETAALLVQQLNEYCKTQQLQDMYVKLKEPKLDNSWATYQLSQSPQGTVIVEVKGSTVKVHYTKGKAYKELDGKKKFGTFEANVLYADKTSATELATKLTEYITTLLKAIGVADQKGLVRVFQTGKMRTDYYRKGKGKSALEEYDNLLNMDENFYDDIFMKGYVSALQDVNAMKRKGARAVRGARQNPRLINKY